MYTVIDNSFIIYIGSTPIEIHINNTNADGMNFINVHQNESTSIEAAKNIIEKFGGKVIYLIHGENSCRNINFTINGENYSIDPNRIFTDTGIKKTLLENNNDFTDLAFNTVKEFANKLLILLDTEKPIISLHNNYNSLSYSFNSYFDQPLSMDVLDIYQGSCVKPNLCPGTGDFFYVTNTEIFNKIKNQQYFNVILQDNRNVIDDGSLSVYCALNNLSYINIEAEHKHLQEQTEMLLTLQKIL